MTFSLLCVSSLLVLTTRRKHSVHHVQGLAVVEPEGKLIQIERQIFGRDFGTDAHGVWLFLQPRLNNRPWPPGQMMRRGLATNTDEYVPKITPHKRAREKSCSTSPPAKVKGINTSTTVRLVTMVRLKT